LLHLFETLSKKESRKAREFVLLGLKKRPWKSLTEDEQDNLTSVWLLYDNVGLLEENGFLEKKIIEKMWGDSIKSCYCKSKETLDDFRKNERVPNLRDVLTEDEARNYIPHFENLAKKLGATCGDKKTV